MATAILALGVATALDPWAFRHLALPDVYGRDWGRLLRILGFLPTWALVSIALVLCDASPDVARASRVRRLRGLLPLVSAALAGLAGEVLKLLLRRERPEAHAGAYVFRSWSHHPFSTGGLALPSSHAVVAFGAAAMLARLYPRARWLWYALAAGCALTRLLARAHFLSDVTLAAIAGWVVAAGLWRWYLRHEGRSAPQGEAAIGERGD
jgi:membrane-associated phospholipid phosphatase